MRQALGGVGWCSQVTDLLMGAMVASTWRVTFFQGSCVLPRLTCTHPLHFTLSWSKQSPSTRSLYGHSLCSLLRVVLQQWQKAHYKQQRHPDSTVALAGENVMDFWKGPSPQLHSVYTHLLHLVASDLVYYCTCHLSVDLVRPDTQGGCENNQIHLKTAI